MPKITTEKVSKTSTTSSPIKSKKSTLNKPNENDLKLIGKIFKKQIEIIRNENHSQLNELATKWLIEARLELMKRIEKEYYKLEESKGNPLKQSDWVLDSKKSLFIITNSVPQPLKSYVPAFTTNLRELLQACGFQVKEIFFYSSGFSSFHIHIKFPLEIKSEGKETSTIDRLEVEDCFSNFNKVSTTPFFEFLTNKEN